MDIPRRCAVCAATLACALPAFAANPPASASIGPVRLSIVDTNLDDGIAASAALAPMSGQHWNLTWRTVDPGGGIWCPDYFGSFVSGSTGSYLSFFEWGETLTATTHAVDTWVPFSESTIEDLWQVTVAPNTRVVFELDATSAEPAKFIAWLEAGGATYSDTLIGSGLLSFEFESGAAGSTGYLTRQARATLDIRGAVSPAPEPGTYALTIAGLLLLAWRQARTNARQHTQTDLLERTAF